MTSFLGALLGGMLSYGIIFSSSMLILYVRTNRRRKRLLLATEQFLKELKDDSKSPYSVPAPAPRGGISN